ncbi:MAG: hypothetical protein M5U34_00235 [Chloroflexi bacterium]|nr:hypothetical protein [Chloroflexota bacterium]
MVASHHTYRGLNHEKLNHIICIGLFLGLTIIAILTLLQRAEAQQQNAGFLYPPYFGTSYISSVFDHEYPLYHREIRFPNDDNLVITSTIRHNDGLPYTVTMNTIPGYSGHDGIDYGLRYEYVLAAHTGTVLELVGTVLHILQTPLANYQPTKTVRNLT